MSYMNMFDRNGPVGESFGISGVSPNPPNPQTPVYRNGVEITAGTVLTIDYTTLIAHNAGTVTIAAPGSQLGGMGPWELAHSAKTR
jgi:hypothetical protein